MVTLYVYLSMADRKQAETRSKIKEKVILEDMIRRTKKD